MVYTKCDEMLLVGWSLFAMQHKGLEEYYTSVLNNRQLLTIIRAEIKSKEILADFVKKYYGTIIRHTRVLRQPHFHLLQVY